MLIYKITSPNNKLYIGQTTQTLEKRKLYHKYDYKKESKKSPLYIDMLKYGFNNFVFEIIEDDIESQEILDKRERYWIKHYDTLNPNKGYNQDSGGKSGCTKSQKTKEKIGITTKNKWKNEQIACRMLKGLQKGTETMKKNGKTNFVECICKECGKHFYVKPYESKNRKFCSIECVNKNNSKNNLLYNNSMKNAVKKHNENIENKLQIKEYIIQWCKDNQNIVLNCPKNSISKHLSGLFDCLYNKYHLKDKRSYYICFNVKNLKDFLEELKKVC